MMKLMWQLQNTFVVSNEDPLLGGPPQTELPPPQHYIIILNSSLKWGTGRQSQQLRGRQSCECFWAVPSSDHLLFFPSEWFSVFGVGLVHWAAIILWRWPLLSIFCLHPSSHYTQSKGKPQSRSSSKRQNCKVKRGRANLSAVTCV